MGLAARARSAVPRDIRPHGLWDAAQWSSSGAAPGRSVPTRASSHLGRGGSRSRGAGGPATTLDL